MSFLSDLSSRPPPTLSTLPVLWPATLLPVALLLSALCTGPAAADELSRVIGLVKPSVVGIGSFQKTRNPSLSFVGTGFAIEDGLTIVTAAHVVAQLRAGDPTATLGILVRGDDEQGYGQRTAQTRQRKNEQVNEQRTEEGTERGNGQGSARAQFRAAAIIALDPQHDLARLRVKGTPLPPLQLGDSDQVREGASLAFIGFPLGMVLGLHHATHRCTLSSITPLSTPSVSARQLDSKLLNQLQQPSYNVFQLDGTAYPGSSGSPLFDPDTGRVLGVVNMVFIKGAKESAITAPSGISYAIPSNFIGRTPTGQP